MKPRFPAVKAVIAVTAFLSAFSLAHAEPVQLEAVLSQKDQMRMDFADGSKRYLYLGRREGQTTGHGMLVGATATEWGMHDVVPGAGVDARGYLVFAMPDGALAYLKTQFRATTVTGTDGKSTNLLNGSWEVVGASGKLSGLQGAGTLRIKVAGPTDRLWMLDGELVQQK